MHHPLHAPLFDYISNVWSRVQILKLIINRFATGWKVRNLNLGVVGRDFLDPTSLLYKGYKVSFLGLKWPGHGVDQPATTSNKVKYGYSYTSSSPLNLLGM
jgi:hypothetical protein